MLRNSIGDYITYIASMLGITREDRRNTGEIPTQDFYIYQTKWLGRLRFDPFGDGKIFEQAKGIPRLIGVMQSELPRYGHVLVNLINGDKYGNGKICSSDFRRLQHTTREHNDWVEAIVERGDATGRRDARAEQ